MATECCSEKRKLPSTDMVTAKKVKLTCDSNKNAIMVLNEAYPGLTYEFTQEGSPHKPCFIAIVCINSDTFEGSGGSKQKAKLQAAILAVKSLHLNQPNSALIGDGKPTDITIQDTKKEGLEYTKDYNFYTNYLEQLAAPTFTIPNYFDFTSDLDNMPGRDRDRPLYAPPRFRDPQNNSFQLRQPQPSFMASTPHGVTMSHRSVSPMLPPQAVAQRFSQLFLDRPAINVEKARCYPVMVLTEIFPDMQINWADGLGRGDRQFKVEADVQGRRFFGEGRSKKIAKLNLAKTILLCMYDIHDFKEAEAGTKPAKVKSEETQLEKKFPLTQIKEMAGEDIIYDVVQQETDNDEKLFNATVVVRGVAYEAVGKSRNLAKLRAAKKALDVLRPKKDVEMILDENGEFVKKEIDTNRHPTMVFYELYRDVKFVESETKGASGLTEYQMEAEVEGITFRTRASSKKKAKVRLVLEAMRKLRNIQPHEWTAIDLKDVQDDKKLTNNPAANHPIVLLLKLNPQSRFEVTEDYECELTTKYKATAYVGDKEFSGEGQNKKSAKTSAARLALQTLYGIDPDSYVEENRSDYFVNSEPKHEVPLELCNLITDAVQEQFTKVFQGETQCKVIAAFVVARYIGVNSNPELAVISIGTGTKCITGDQIDHKGQTLNDCHGEIIACRGFRQFLFDELLLAVKKDPNTIFTRKSNGKYVLQPNIHVYLYVNTAPCGDGRVFTLQTQQQGAKNKTAGLLRTKIENGQGTIPVPENNVQTSDGILEGERLRTMSCSDKILKWNTLGVQGSLLSYFIDPIYVEGIVIGLHYHYEALYRALYKRAGKMTNCPDPYHLNNPGLGTPNNVDNSRDTSKATSNSFNWYHHQRTVEAVNSTTGQTVIMTPSRLCKLNFFDKFMQVMKAGNLNTHPKTYHAAKRLAVDYTKAKNSFFKALDETTCGKWVGKPYEHDMFGY